MRRLVEDLVRAPARATLRAARAWKLALLVLGTNLGLTLVFTLPLAVPLVERYAHSQLARGRRGFDPALLSDLSRLLEPHGGVLGGEVLAWLVLAQLVAIVLSGGVVSALVDGKTSLVGFAGASARHLGRNVRLAAWSLVALAPIVAVASVSARLIHHATERSTLLAPSDAWRDLRFAAIVALLIVWRLLLSAGRVLVVTDDLGATWRAYLRGARLCLARPTLLVAWALLGGVGVLATGLVATAHGISMAPASARGALGVFALAQLVVWVRTVFAVAETELVRGALRPSP